MTKKVSCKATSKPICALNIPLRPPNVKKYVNDRTNNSDTSNCGAEFSSVTHQCRTFVLAGTEIITVIVLYRVRVVFARPTIYIWCPHTANDIKAIVYIENCNDNLPDSLFRNK